MADPRSPPLGRFVGKVSKSWKMIKNGSWHQRKRLLNRRIRIPRQNNLQLNMEHADNSIRKGKETASVKYINDNISHVRGLGFQVNYGFL